MKDRLYTAWEMRAIEAACDMDHDEGSAEYRNAYYEKRRTKTLRSRRRPGWVLPLIVAFWGLTLAICGVMFLQGEHYGRDIAQYQATEARYHAVEARYNYLRDRADMRFDRMVLRQAVKAERGRR